MNKNQLLQLRALASQEYTVEQIADKLHLSRSEVEYTMLERGYRRRYDDPSTLALPRYYTGGVVLERRVCDPDESGIDTPRCRSGRISDDEIGTIIEKHRKGDCATVIARKIGRHPGTVHRILKRYGYE